MKFVDFLSFFFFAGFPFCTILHLNIQIKINAWIWLNCCVCEQLSHITSIWLQTEVNPSAFFTAELSTISETNPRGFVNLYEYEDWLCIECYLWKRLSVPMRRCRWGDYIQLGRVSGISMDSCEMRLTPLIRRAGWGRLFYRKSDSLLMASLIISPHLNEQLRRRRTAHTKTLLNAGIMRNVLINWV